MKKYFPILSVILVFLAFAFVMVKIYEKGENEQPLSKSEIPQETIDFLTHLGSGISDILVRIKPESGPKDWDNDGDFGHDPKSNLDYIEDEYFIVYYTKGMKSVAGQVLSDAHESIDRQTEIFGVYYYPKDVYGRKLPIYVTETQEQYTRIVNKLCGSKGDRTTTAGVFIYRFTYNNVCISDGVVMNGRYTNKSRDYRREVLFHEMNHYVFFTGLNYKVLSYPSMWVYEGLADYASHSKHKFNFSRSQIEEMRKQCNLSDDNFPYVYQNYEGGESIYHYLCRTYSEKDTFEFVRNLLKHGVKSSLKSTFSMSLEELESRWKEALPDINSL